MVQLHFGETLGNILNDLPGEGFLLPRIAPMKESDRAKAFMRRCNLVGVSGVSLHSYRYAWAERAKTCGYPERFAMENFGTWQQCDGSCVCEESQGAVAFTGRIRTENRAADSVIQNRSPRAQADNSLLAPFFASTPCPSALGLQSGRLPFVRRVLLPGIFDRQYS